MSAPQIHTPTHVYASFSTRVHTCMHPGMMPQMPGGMGNANNIPLGNTQRINPFANQQQQMPPQQPGTCVR